MGNASKFLILGESALIIMGRSLPVTREKLKDTNFVIKP